MNNKISKEIKKIGVKTLSGVGLKDRIIEPPSKEQNTSLVYFALMSNTENINSIENDDGIPLPASLIISKGNYQFHGKTYRLDREGLYRFIFPVDENQQRIVYESNLDSLLSSICWIFSHGNIDDGEDFSYVNKKALTSKIFVTCGPLSSWANKFLDNLSIKSRIVSTLTLDPWNSYDNGHILVEIFRYDLNKWVVYDLDNGCFFTCNKKPLSLIEFVESVPLNNYEIHRLTNRANMDISNFRDRKSNFDFAFIVESRLSNEEKLREWYRHVIQIPLILDGKFSYFFNTEHVKKIQSYSSYHKFLEKDEFMKKFYQNE